MHKAIVIVYYLEVKYVLNIFMEKLYIRTNMPKRRSQRLANTECYFDFQFISDSSINNSKIGSISLFRYDLTSHY